MHEKYYKRWGIFIKNPFWQGYLKKMYEDGFKKIAYLTEQQNPFNKQNFTALLSGCHGESTAETFARFVLLKNPHAKVIILDINPISIKQCQKKLASKFPDRNIVFLQENILNNSLSSNTIDYIETDGFLQFFEPKKQLPLVIAVWKRMLKPDGFITTRDVLTTNIIGRTIAEVMRWLAKIFFGVKIYHQTLAELEKTYFKQGFFIEVRTTWFPALRQITAIKQ